jgi:hypothetical protein
MYIKLPEYRIQNKEYKVKKLMHKKLPFPFFIWCLDLMILMRANPSLRLLEGRGLKISPFFVPKWHSNFRAQKNLNFQGHPLLMALVMDVAHIKISMSHAI